MVLIFNQLLLINTANPSTGKFGTGKLDEKWKPTTKSYQTNLIATKLSSGLRGAPRITVCPHRI
jgi:hypothetical protein